jgi:hypothetical protein
VNHDEAQALVRDLFVGGEVDAAQQAALRAHLRTCADCRGLYDRWAEAEAAVGETYAASASAQRVWPSVAASAPSRSRASSWRIAGGALAAVAAALALWVTLPAPMTVEHGALPEYNVTLRPIQQTHRSADVASTERAVLLRNSDPLDLIVRPATRFSGPIRAEGFWVGAGDTRRSFALQGAEGGSFRYRGEADVVLPPAGEWTLVVYVAREDARPSDERIAALATGTATSSYDTKEKSFEAAVGQEDVWFFVVPVVVVD